MEHYICTACGTQFAETREPPATCPICTDERQFVPPAGQTWTTLGELQRAYRTACQQLEPGLLGIGTSPEFAIGQRALLVRTPRGNVLWDCVALVDDATVATIRAQGGLEAIAISHPHYYTTMVEWSSALGNVPIVLHRADEAWVMRPHSLIRFWDGERYALAPDLTLIRCGGHFPGGTVLHWSRGAEGRGALLTGDILQVVEDRRHVSFMRSYPNLIPLSAAIVRRIGDALEPFAFDRIYGAWWDRHITSDAKRAVRASVDRYVRWLDAPATSESA